MPRTTFKNDMRITGNLTVGGTISQTTAGQTQAMTATAAVTAGVKYLSLNHATVVIAATMVATNHPGEFTVTDNSASGTAAHTVTLTGGTWDGTNTIATLNAPGESLTVFFTAAGVGSIVRNIGAVGLS